MDSKPLKGSMNGVTSNGVFEALDETAVTYRVTRSNAPAVAEVMRRLTQEGKIPVLVDGDFSMEIYNCCGLLMDYSGVDPQPYGIIWNCHIAGEDDNGNGQTAEYWVTYSNPTLLLDENEEEQEYDPSQDEWKQGFIEGGNSEDAAKRDLSNVEFPVQWESSDGFPAKAKMRFVACGNGVWVVAVSGSNKAWWTEDFKIFTTCTVPPRSAYLGDGAYNSEDNVFVSFKSSPAKSTDGKTWEPMSFAFSGAGKVGYGNGLCIFQRGTSAILVSHAGTDSMTYSVKLLPSSLLDESDTGDVYFCKNAWLMSLYDSYGAYKPSYAYSLDDGATWAVLNYYSKRPINAHKFWVDGERFCYVYQENGRYKVRWSVDAQAWADSEPLPLVGDSAGVLCGAAGSDGITAVVVKYDSKTVVYTTTDMATWQGSEIDKSTSNACLGIYGGGKIAFADVVTESGGAETEKIFYNGGIPEFFEKNAGYIEQVAGGGGCEIVKYTAASQAAITEMAEAITAVVEAGKMPILITGTTTKIYWNCVSASPDEIIFIGYSVNVVAATISAVIERIYKQDGTWMRSRIPVDFEQ